AVVVDVGLVPVRRVEDAVGGFLEDERRPEEDAAIAFSPRLDLGPQMKTAVLAVVAEQPAASAAADPQPIDDAPVAGQERVVLPAGQVLAVEQRLPGRFRERGQALVLFGRGDLLGRHLQDRSLALPHLELPRDDWTVAILVEDQNFAMLRLDREAALR